MECCRRCPRSSWLSGGRLRKRRTPVFKKSILHRVSRSCAMLSSRLSNMYGADGISVPQCPSSHKMARRPCWNTTFSFTPLCATHVGVTSFQKHIGSNQMVKSSSNCLLHLYIQHALIGGYNWDNNFTSSDNGSGVSHQCMFVQIMIQ